MKLNESTALATPKILLVPYAAHHVPQYHTWMQDPSLQAATASEPLTLEQEYAMQKSWREDGDKLTFIACLPIDGEEGVERDDSTPAIAGGTGRMSVDREERMIGDVNLFVTESEEDSDDEEGIKVGGPQECVGEVEIMVARKDVQGKGVGTAILLTFMFYIIEHLDAIIREYSDSKGSPFVMRYLRVKINADNSRSLRLFEKVGFRKASETSNYFGELELRYSLEDGGNSEDAATRLAINRPSVLKYQLS